MKNLASNSTFKKLRSWHQSHQFIANRRGEVETVSDSIFLGSQISVDVTATIKLKKKKKTLAPWKKIYDNTRQLI